MTLISAAVGAKQNTLTTSSTLSISSITTTALSTHSGGLRVSGGGGTYGVGSVLRIVSSGDSVYSPASIFSAHRTLTCMFMSFLILGSLTGIE